MVIIKNTASSGVFRGLDNFIGLLAIVFITLKLLGNITWSWWWVLSPLWISCLLVIVMSVVLLVRRRVSSKMR